MGPGSDQASLLSLIHFHPNNTCFQTLEGLFRYLNQHCKEYIVPLRYSYSEPLNSQLLYLPTRTCQNVNPLKPFFLRQKVVFKTKNELISEAYFLDINHLTWSDPIPYSRRVFCGRLHFLVRQNFIYSLVFE